MKMMEEMALDLDFKRPKLFVYDKLCVIENVSSIVMIGENLEKKHIKRINDIDKDTAIEEFRKDHREMLEMVFEGIDK